MSSARLLPTWHLELGVCHTGTWLSVSLHHDDQKRECQLPASRLKIHHARKPESGIIVSSSARFR